ncbi:hypothetical protein GCM10017044_21020 [Kordiimonas sediminis]|uniref:SPOR domain-containing protein n=1 Tax=Kordiimonas sediminis TaxID=1735581 RepID=A0A919AUB7_9PROT|nr:SPOR domain-containing protein [Kordiimonas sediminis]GHF25971.1 hypothetical protein GCM10017044_21020 [Kordiimonas sediminis]
MDKETPPWLQPVPAEEQSESLFSGDKTMMFIAGGAIVIVILFISVIAMLYSVDDSNQGPVRVAAPSTPVKERPEDRGGMRVDHQDKQVFDRSGDTIPSSEMALGEQAEDPLADLPQEAVEEVQTPTVDDKAFLDQSQDNRIDEQVAEISKSTADASAPKTSPAENTAKEAPKTSASEPAATTPDMAGKYKVQLGAFGSREGAERTARDLKRKFRDALSGLTPIYEPVNTGDRTLYRLRFGPINTRSEVDRICLALTEKGQGCMAVNP